MAEAVAGNGLAKSKGDLHPQVSDLACTSDTSIKGVFLANDRFLGVQTLTHAVILVTVI